MLGVRAVGLPTIRTGSKTEYFFLIITFRLLMDYMYRSVMATSFGYMGFDYHSNVGMAVLSWLVLLIGARLLYRAYRNKESYVSFEVVFLLFVMSFVPFTSMLGSDALETPFIICNTLFWLFFLTFTVSFRKKKRNRESIKANRFGLDDMHLKVLAVIFALIVLYVSGRYTRFRFNLNILKVYEYRAEAKSNQLPTWLSYAFSWTRTVNTILIAYFIRRKMKLWTVGACLVQLLSFGYDGSKSTLFLLVLAVGVNLLPRFDMGKMNTWALRGITALIALLAIHYYLTGNIVAISVFIRRVFYLPVRIAKDYLDFFTKHQPDYFRQSFLRHFGIKSPYPTSIPYLIGDVYFNQPDMSANNGLISDAITNLGYVGIFVFPLLYSFMFRILDKSSEGLDPRMFITVGIYLSLVMTNSFFFSILLTHGLIVTIVVMFFMKRDGRQTVLIDYL